MVGMAVGQDDLGNGRRWDAGSFEVLRKLSRRGLMARAGACVDQTTSGWLRITATVFTSWSCSPVCPAAFRAASRSAGGETGVTRKPVGERNDRRFPPGAFEAA